MKTLIAALQPLLKMISMDNCLIILKKNDCPTMDHCLRVYNVADVVVFTEVFRKMAEQYYLDKIDVCKDTISITSISMKYVLKMSLENRL